MTSIIDMNNIISIAAPPKHPIVQCLLQDVVNKSNQILEKFGEGSIDKNLKKYNCGKEAADALAKKINKNPVVCKVQKKLDRYKRYIGVCFLGDLNLNKWMVRNGHAVAYRRYSKDYIQDENYAKKNKIGLWSGNFIHPEKWRKLN